MPKLHILLAPSESKEEGGNLPYLDKESLIFPKLYDKRLPLLQAYQETVDRYNIDELSKMFGLKKEAEIQKYALDIFHSPTMKAIERYTGVAFDYLGYKDLNTQARNFIDENVLLFSNLFGPIRARDHLPFYKFKQGEKLSGFAIESYYKEHFTDALDDHLDGDVIDLRAGVYEKFYKITKPYTTFKFLKEGKVVSHWAKAYRGRLLKVLAEHQINSVDELEQVLPDDMKLVEKKVTKNKSEWIIEVQVGI